MQGDEIRAHACSASRRHRHTCSPVSGAAQYQPRASAHCLSASASAPVCPFTIFPHMLRHACGYALANAGHDTRALQAWLGHKNIQHTVRYTELAPDRFKNFWR
jgi:site-specific recombinase XerD